MSKYVTKEQMIDISEDMAGKIKTALDEKGGQWTFDDVPVENSNNPVKSGGIYSTLDSMATTFNGSISSLQSDITGINNKIGANSGIATLDENGKVPSSELPSYVDDVIEGYYNSEDGKFYEDQEGTKEITGESGKIYTDLGMEKTYRWGGTAYTEISQSIALGETSSTAYPGNKGKANADAISTLQTGKVDKEENKGLSTNDYTTDEKNKLAGLSNYDDTEVKTSLAGKVDKVTGKGLSTNDYTDEDQTKLAGISDLSAADVTEVKNSFSLT